MAGLLFLGPVGLDLKMFLHKYENANVSMNEGVKRAGCLTRNDKIKVLVER